MPDTSADNRLVVAVDLFMSLLETAADRLKSLGRISREGSRGFEHRRLYSVCPSLTETHQVIPSVPAQIG